MPKMTHWNSPDPIEVSTDKAAVYAAQGWVTVDAKPSKVQPGVTREAAPKAAAEATDTAPRPAAKKSAAKKATKKAAKKS